MAAMLEKRGVGVLAEASPISYAFQRGSLTLKVFESKYAENDAKIGFLNATCRCRVAMLYF